MSKSLSHKSDDVEQGDENCIFCRIASGKVPCSKVYEDEVVLAFLDASPVNRGHTLVISKDHYETIMDTTEDTLKHIIEIVQKVATALSDDADGVTIVQNNNKAGGQIVPHIHFHVIPRFINDGHKHNWKNTTYASDSQRDKIRNTLSNRIE